MNKKSNLLKNWQYFNSTFEYENIFQDIDWPWAGHKHFVYDFVRNTQPERIVELGTHKGTSFFSMCQAVKDGGYSSSLTAVDTWKGDSHAGYYDESVFKEVQKIIKKYYSSQDIRLIKNTFDEALQEFKPKSIDLLHIDGLHTYEAVKHDFQSWYRKVKLSGTIMLHDTYEKMNDFGVYQLWDELKLIFKYIEFFHSHGLGVLILNPAVNQIENFQTIWQKYYELYYHFDKINFQHSNLQQQYKVLSAKSESQTKEIDILFDQLRKQTKQTELLSKQVDLNERINAAKIRINYLENDLNKIKSSKFFQVWQGYNAMKKMIAFKI